MPPYVFPGYPKFLEAAAADLGRPESVNAARRIGALSDLANLCAQAAHADPAHVEAILDRATEFRNRLEVVFWAAEMMLADARAGLIPARPEDDPAETEPTSDPAEPGPAPEDAAEAQAEAMPDAPDPVRAPEDPDPSEDDRDRLRHR